MSVTAGRATPVEVAVTMGDTPATDVTLEFGGGIEVVEVPGNRGWTGVKSGPSSVHFTGGTADANACLRLSVVIKSDAPGTYAMRAKQLIGGSVVEHPAQGDVQLNPDGTSTIVNYDGPPNPAFEQTIEVKAAGSNDNLIIVLALVAGVALVGLALVVPVRGKQTSKGQDRRKSAPPKRRKA